MKNKNKTILSLKYRPQNFEGLIGQETMVQTIVNSIKFNKIPNAYLLTGIRGVGKTTTARIIAKALNCNKHFDHGENNKEQEFCHCEEISNSNHIDVIEMDAASKTGIDDIRELIDSSRYYPSSAKYKIYIIDEVHMLSKQAFNGLLKTLEEPPLHLKFIFATTELKKIPVTIISRCQRFDLNRVSIENLFDNLKRISKLENGKITHQALKLIAKVSEGSVRDSLSLLDRVLISQNVNNKEIDENFVQSMLGLADKSEILELLKSIISGEANQILTCSRELIEKGADIKSILNELLETIYHITSLKTFGNLDLEKSISESELILIKDIANKVDKKVLFIFWQFILKGLDEINIASNQIISFEMIMLRLAHVKNLPNYEDVILNIIKNNNEISSLDDEEVGEKIAQKENKSPITNQIKNITQKIPEISQPKKKDNQERNFENIESFESLVILASKKKEIEIKYDLEKNVNLVSFSQGKINISFNENLSKNFIKNLSEKLLKWTGKRWVITLTREIGQKTVFEKRIENEKIFLEKERKDKFFKNFKEFFPDANLDNVNLEDE